MTKPNMLIVTSGGKYIDIDAYASCISYAYLLKSINIKAKALTTAPFNESIPKLIKKIDLTFDNYTPMENDRFILLDVSDPNMFDKIVKLENIVSVIDHHTGYEYFWEERKLHNKVDEIQIEFIGSICTIVYEKFVKYNCINLLTNNICKLLTAGILDNTLNLKSSITTKRDINAYNELIRIGNLDSTWVKEYFKACEEEILNDLEKAIINDIKNVKENQNLPAAFGQLTLYNGKAVLEQIDLIKKIFNTYDEWMLNVISLNDGKSYIVTSSRKSKADIENLFHMNFIGDVLTLDKFMLRKEIIKKAQEC